ncbi:MAG: asparaginase [Eubacterium sp.]|nr:asparaginase [Eubacterium sp.]
MEKKIKKKKIIILATGGTIAGTGEEGKMAGYKPGAVTAEKIIETVPGLKSVADIETVQICNVNSDDITSEIWLSLARTINDMAKNPEVDGFVITHGTDTLEETAYFLNLTIKTDKPVVVTGSMRPSTAISADGPANLCQAVTVASSEKAAGKGVLVVFADRIYAARSVTKSSTYHLTAISGGESGALGVVRDGNVYFYNTPEKCHTVSTGFDISNIDILPKVNVVYFSVDADPGLLDYAAKQSDGIIIAGAGAGEFSEQFKSIIEKLEIPVVISSRVNDGIIIGDNLICEKTIAGDNLPPQKAAVLLRLALTKNMDISQIRNAFLVY